MQVKKIKGNFLVIIAIVAESADLSKGIINLL